MLIAQDAAAERDLARIDGHVIRLAAGDDGFLKQTREVKR